MRLTLIVAAIILSVTVRAQAVQRPDDAELIRRIDAYVAPLAAHELSGTLLVARGNRVLVEKSFGFANYELRVPFTPTTPTNVASITKPLTIIITSRLAEAKQLSRVRFLSPKLMLFGDRALVPLNDSTFMSTADYARVTFASGASGAVEKIAVHVQKKQQLPDLNHVNHLESHRDATRISALTPDSFLARSRRGDAARSLVGGANSRTFK